MNESASAPSSIEEGTSAPARSLQSFLFGGATIGSRAADAGVLLLRVVAGLALAFAHGMGKLPPSMGFVERIAGMGFPSPGLFAWMVAALEFGGGLLLAIGLLTRPVALLIGIHMLLVISLAHAGDPFGDREKAVLFGSIALLFLLAGAGRYSLDAMIRPRDH